MSLPTLLIISILYLLLVLLLVFAVRRNRRRRTPVSPSRTVADHQDTNSLAYLRRSGLYWGVRLQTREGMPSCAAAQAIQDQAFPLTEAPELPLAGCDLPQGQCHCHYRPLLDQRDGKLRRIHPDRRSILRYEPGKKDRRQLPGRRAKDRQKPR